MFRKKIYSQLSSKCIASFLILLLFTVIIVKLFSKKIRLTVNILEVLFTYHGITIDLLDIVCVFLYVVLICYGSGI